MKHKFLLSFVLWFACIIKSTALDVGGIISANATWTVANSPYVVTSSITINSGITLTIQSGVTVKFNDGFGMTVLGTLDATGTTFTSNSVSPSAGKWTTLTVGSSTSSGWVSMNTCQLLYGQFVNVVRGTINTNSTDISNFQSYAIYLNGYTTDSAKANITGGNFTNVGTAGIYSNSNGKFILNGTNMSSAQYGIYTNSNSNSPSSVTGGTYSGMTQAAFYSGSNPLVTLSSVTINGGCARGIYLNGGTMSVSSTTITACTTPIEYQGPSTLIMNGAANNLTGNTNKYVLMSHSSLTSSIVLPSISLPYYFPNGYTIGANGRLQLSDGNILKFPSSGITVSQGKLVASASMGSQIYFTSFKDDNLGGDANGDAGATAPSRGDWSGISFPDGSIDSACILRRVTIKYANYGVNPANASPTIDSCTFSINNYGVYATDASYPVINGCTFGSSGTTPIALTFDADPVFTGNIFSFQDNQYDAIGLIGSSITANATLKIRSVTGVSNVTYVMLGNITIPAGKSLTINKGVVIKSPYQSYYRIDVLGALYGNGSADSNIVFTSARDDNAGSPGDTNKDGTQTSPARGDFGGIVFAPGSLSASTLNYCDIRFASLNQTTYANQNQSGGAITTVNASPSINNCKISNCNIGVMCYQSSNPSVTNTQVINALSTPLAIAVTANPSFSNITTVNAGLLGLGIIGGTVSANGLVKKQNVYGYNNITYVLLGSLSIASGASVEVENGVVIKFGDYLNITVDGGLKFSGTGTSRITLTTLRDDNVGNPFDTNGDGNATTPGSGNWGYIRYNSTSDDIFSALRSVDIKFGGYGGLGSVNWLNAAAAMDDCNILNTSGYGIKLEGNSNPVIDSTSIQSSTSDPIAMSLLSDPTFSNITFAANATRGIRISDVNLSSNAILKKRSLAGISNIAYYIENLTIDATATLTIDAGVVIKSLCVSPYYRTIIVNGAINALGTNQDKIIFTSTKDDSNGGDYNNDGNASAPAKSDWHRITFNASSLPSSLKNCVFRYGGFQNGVLEFVSATNITIDSTVIEQTSAPALYISGSSSFVFKNSQLVNINNVPVQMAMFSNPTFTNISLSNVRDIGLGIISETYSQTATIPVRNFGGYNNITYIGLGNYIINAGTTITIPAGIVFKGGYWIVNGRLNVLGTNSSPVVFTSIADDAYGNPLDTRQDGNLQDPASGSYSNGTSAIVFNDISNDSSTLKNTYFRYYLTGVLTGSASPTIDSCTFYKCRFGVNLQGVSQPILTNCKFNDLSFYNYTRGYPIAMSILSYPASTVNNSLSGITSRALFVLNETLSQDVTLAKRNFAGITNIPYVFEGFTVGSGATLTIAPGVVCKFTSGQLYVNKGLIAEGGATADSTIVFTSIYDDFYGGDTNADSNYTAQNVNYNNWSGIALDNQALNTLCRFKNVIIKYATYGILMTSKSPIISNSLFTINAEAIRMTGASNPVISNCDFMNNQTWGVNNVDKSFTVSATNCWWGSNTGPTHTANAAGTGDKVTDAVLYTPFRTIDAQNPMMGDVSLNGKVQAYDAALVLQNAVSLVTFNAIQNRVADVSGTAGITAFDGSLILQFVVDKIRTFPAEELFKSRPRFPASAKLTLGNAMVDAGAEVTIPVVISAVQTMKAFDLYLKYDASVLDVISVTNGQYLEGKNVSQHFNAQDGIIQISAAAAEDMAISGEVLWIKLKVKSTAATQAVQFKVLKFLANEDDLTQQVSGGEITIRGVATGLGTINNLSIGRVYPNPFSDRVSIPFSIHSAGNVSIDIYSIIGKKVYSNELTDVRMGSSEFSWNGTGNTGERLEAGTYFIYLKSAGDQVMQKVTLIR